MKRNIRGIVRCTAFVTVTLMALVAASCGGSTSESTPEVGVTPTAVRIGVGVSDLDGLRAAGFALAPGLTTANLSKRVTKYFDEWNAAGGINGRTVEPVVLTWDPLKASTQEKFCADATINGNLFAVIVASGLSNSTIRCVVDAGVPLLFGEVSTDAALETGVLVTVAPSAEVMAGAGVRTAIESGTIPRASTVGILAGNGPEGVAGAQTTKAALESAGYKTVSVSLNTLGGDAGALNSESAASVNTFKAAGVTHVIVLVGFVPSSGFWNAVPGQGFTFTILDTSSAGCTAFGASRTPGSAAGATCVTAANTAVTSSGQLRTESDFEKECRAFYDSYSTADFPTKSYPGVPSGETIKFADGTVVSGDFPYNECTLTNVMNLALTKAGKNLTRSSFLKAASELGEVPVALSSDGIGSLTDDKHYIADLVHSVRLVIANALTPRNSSGTFDGCPVPRTCWVPQSDRWYPIG